MRVGDQRPRLLSLPANVDNTEAGGEVIELARRFGLSLDDWQRWVVQQMCAERADGSWAATQVVLLVPRQCGKSAIFEVIEMAALFLWDEQHVIYSAHLDKTATDHRRRITRLIDRVPDFKRIAHVRVGKGDQSVERTDTGAVLEFITRGKKSARGGSPNRVIFDEAMFLTDDQVQAMLPSMSAQSMNDDAPPQMVYGSSAPIAESEVLHRLRTRGIEHRPARMFFAEWSVEDGADASDRDNWYRSNPGLGIRISEEWIADNEFGTLSPEAFGVERLGVPVLPLSATSDSVISPAGWSALVDTESRIVSNRCFALDVSPDRRWSSFGAAGRRVDGLVHVEAFDTRPGTDWVLDAGMDLWARWSLPIRIEKGSPAGSFISQLRERNVEVVEVSRQQHADAVGQLLMAVESRSVRHLGATALNAAVKAADVRPSGDVELWARRSSKANITPLVAVTIALGGVPDAGGPVIADDLIR